MMVGLWQSPAVEDESEEGKGAVKFEPAFDSKHQLSTPTDPFDPCLLELEDDSLSFIDSLLNFEYIDSLLAEGGCDFGTTMDVDELGASKGGFEMGDGECKGDGIGGVLGAKEVKLEKEKGEWVERSGELCNIKEEFASIGVAGSAGADGTAEKMGDLGCFIEERLGKVKLEGTSDCVIPVVLLGNNKNVRSDMGLVSGSDGSRSHKMVGRDDTGPVSGIVRCGPVDTKTEGTVNAEDGSSSDMESEPESSSSESSTGDSDGEGKAHNADTEQRREDGTDIEEGEIMLSDADEMVAWSDNEDAEHDGARGPIKSKNELEVLPPVPPVTVTLEPHHQTLPVGTILSILGPQVIVEGVEKHNPLNEGSILWITDTRLALGIIDEIFGPVKNPYYIVRYNSESEVPSGIQQGTPISFVPEFASHVLNDKSLYQKGYDASGENDEELLDEMEFSDDEKEAEYKRILKLKKRETNVSKPGNKLKDKRRSNNLIENCNHKQYPAASGDKTLVSEVAPYIALSSGLGQDMPQKDNGKLNNWTGNWNGNKDSVASGDNQPVAEQQHLVPSVATSSSIRQDMPGNQPMVPQFWPRSQAPGFPVSSGMWNGSFLPLGPQSAGLPGGLPPNGMQWMQQNNPYQLPQVPLPVGIPFQQQMSTFPQFPLNFGQANIGRGPGVGPWSVPQFGFGFQAPGASLSQSGGGEQLSQQPPRGSQIPLISPAKSGTARRFDQGRGGGRGQHRGRGSFGGGRGRLQGR